MRRDDQKNEDSRPNESVGVNIILEDGFVMQLEESLQAEKWLDD